MTKEEFLEIQSEVLSGGKQLKSILAAHGVPYSTYNYWRNKITSNDGIFSFSVFITILFQFILFIPLSTLRISG
mgnify:FL=1